MILDKQALFSDEQAITAAALSDNVMDMRVLNRRLGTGTPLEIVLAVTEDMTDAGSDSTLTVQLVGDADEALASPQVLQELFTVPAASPAGTQLAAYIRQGIIA